MNQSKAKTAKTRRSTSLIDQTKSSESNISFEGQPEKSQEVSKEMIGSMNVGPAK